MATSALAATGLVANQAAIVQQQLQQHALLDSTSAATVSAKSTAPTTRVAIRDGKTVGINDHIYLSPAWAPGAGEPYMIARVMEFVTAASSRSGAAALASSSGTLQVRANLFLRTRDISLKTNNDPRLLVATMHSDVFSLDNIRGICEVRHRDLIGQGKAPEVSQWKKKEDHFYYHQLYDRYIHRFYDVIPTDKIKNAPLEVLNTLRVRYSFVAAEAGTGMITDLTDALRGCCVCREWASGPESVRCDTCRKYFHMKCLNPPLISKPAKGYSWTCAPCSKRHEQNVEDGLHAASTSTDSSAQSQSVSQSSTRGQPSVRGRGAISVKGRGRPPNSGKSHPNNIQDEATATSSPNGTPMPERTADDIRGTRCFNRWPYRYFGQHTHAQDVIDLHDSVYPIATTRIGPKYQATLPTWEEQQEQGLGTHITTGDKAKDEDAQAVTTSAPTSENMQSAATLLVNKKRGRPIKRKRDANDRSDTPTATGTTTPVPGQIAAYSEAPEFERGSEQTAEAIYLPHDAQSEAAIDSLLTEVRAHFKTIEPYYLDLIVRTLRVYTANKRDTDQALSALVKSTPEELRIVNWSAKDVKQFEIGIHAVNSDMKQLKTYIPGKKIGDIVRYFVLWKLQRIRAEREPQTDAMQEDPAANKEGGGSPGATSSKSSTSRAVSPSLSVYGDAEIEEPTPVTCAMCSTTTSSVWYKGPATLSKRVLCVSCGLYWRKYAAEPFNTDLVSVNTRNKTSSAEDSLLGVAPPTKAAKLSKDGKVIGASAPAVPLVPKPEPIKCVMCRRIEPRKKLAQCRNCSLSVHQGCYGLTDEELEMDQWICDPCDNEVALEAALLPRCILCSPSAQEHAAITAAKNAPPVVGTPSDRPRGRPKKDANPATTAASAARSAPLGALDAFKMTECNNWAHVLCSVWMPEVVFSDVSRLKLVESCGNLATWRYEAECGICNDQRGACVTCSEPFCRKTFHVSCAYNHQPGFTLAFEIIPVKGSRREVIPTLTFKGETGHMVPQLWCKDHKEVAKTKKLYDLAEVDPKTSLTALQMFVRTNKHVATTPAAVNQLQGETTYALLRRAKRYDSLLSTPTTLYHPLAKRSPSNILVEPATTQAKAKQCANCKSPFSPYWWKMPLKNEDDEIPQGSLCCNFCKETTFKSLNIQ